MPCRPLRDDPSEGPPRAGIRFRAAVLLAAALAVAGPAGAQSAVPEPQPRNLAYWAVNAGIATISGWIQGRPSGQPLHRAVLAGLAGGTLMYAGQRIVGAGNPHLRIVALETVSVGTSVTRNIALGSSPFSELNFILFPFYVRVRPRAETTVSVRVSLFGLVQAVRTGLRYDAWPDLRQSLATGAPVFAVAGQVLKCLSPDCTVRVVGQHRYGNFAYAVDGDACLCHETLHLVQDVRDAGLHALPASDWVLQRSGSFGRWLSRYVVVDGFLPLLYLGSNIVAERFDPACRGLGTFTECEATSLAHNR
jgi:hypothetical protein